jgi:glucosamine-6-phosphate deaminase
MGLAISTFTHIRSCDMEVVICESARQVARLAADVVAALLGNRPEAVLGLATGSSPLALYDELIARHREDRISFCRARAFLLDEYIGLPAGHSQEYRQVIDRAIASPLGFATGAVMGPDGNAEDIPRECADYERAIQRSGGVDLQILGIGKNGHLAFNEPGSSLASRTRVKTLTEQTRRDNARFFGDDVAAVPQHAITQGLATISEARHLLLLALGTGKAEAVHQMIEGAVTALWPATVLQHHPHVTVLLDGGAATRLRLAAYYRETFAHKPAWQDL